MRFICLGYLEESKWDALAEAERRSIIEHCHAYDDDLKAGGHFLGKEALKGARDAVTLRIYQKQVVVTDGPYAETKEQLGGILFLEARDLNHAIALMSCHPGARVGTFEIRPLDETIHSMSNPASDQTIDFTHDFAAPPARVYAAWTDPARLPRWWGPDEDGRPFTVTRCDLQPQKGGRYRVVMRSPGGETFVSRGMYQEVVPGERLIFTFAWEEDGILGHQTLVRLTFTPAGEGTNLRFEQGTFPSRDARDSHESGWREALAHLDRYLAENP